MYSPRKNGIILSFSFRKNLRCKFPRVGCNIFKISPIYAEDDIRPRCSWHVYWRSSMNICLKIILQTRRWWRRSIGRLFMVSSWSSWKCRKSWEIYERTLLNSYRSVAILVGLLTVIEHLHWRKKLAQLQQKVRFCARSSVHPTRRNDRGWKTSALQVFRRYISGSHIVYDFLPGIKHPVIEWIKYCRWAFIGHFRIRHDLGGGWSRYDYMAYFIFTADAYDITLT